MSHSIPRLRQKGLPMVLQGHGGYSLSFKRIRRLR